MPRTLTLTVALDWPESAGDAKVLVDALREEFRATREPRFRGPFLGLGIELNSTWLAGNADIPRIWRRVVRYLEKAAVLSNATDPWCIGARVYEVDREPHLVLTLKEE